MLTFFQSSICRSPTADALLRVNYAPVFFGVAMRLYAALSPHLHACPWRRLFCVRRNDATRLVMVVVEERDWGE